MFAIRSLTVGLIAAAVLAGPAVVAAAAEPTANSTTTIEAPLGPPWGP
jgi:hypothetical protein